MLRRHAYNNVLYPSKLSTVLRIYDEKKVVFGPRDLEQATRPEAVIVSTNDAIIEWAISVFDEHTEKTEPILIEETIRALADAGVDFQNLFRNQQNDEESDESEE